MRAAATASVYIPALYSTDNAHIFHAAFSTRIKTTGYADFHFAWHFLRQIFAFNLHAKMYAVLFSAFTECSTWADFYAAHAVRNSVRWLHAEHFPSFIYVFCFQIRNHNALAASQFKNSAELIRYVDIFL